MARRKKPTKPAEVISIKQPDQQLIETLQDMLNLAIEGRLTSFVGHLTVDYRDEFVLLGNVERPLETIGALEEIKSLVREQLLYGAAEE